MTNDRMNPVWFGSGAAVSVWRQLDSNVTTIIIAGYKKTLIHLIFKKPDSQTSASTVVRLTCVTSFAINADMFQSTFQRSVNVTKIHPRNDLKKNPYRNCHLNSLHSS